MDQNKRGPGWPNMLKKFDLFPGALPGFNIGGQQQVDSNTGGLVSISILFMVLTFALLKLEELISKSNPTISSSTQEDAFHTQYGFDTGASDFMMAFALVDSSSNQPYSDPRYYKWYARYFEKLNGKKTTQKVVPLRQCTSEDYEKFYKPAQGSYHLFQQLKNSAGMFCLDW